MDPLCFIHRVCVRTYVRTHIQVYCACTWGVFTPGPVIGPGTVLNESIVVTCSVCVCVSRLVLCGLVNVNRLLFSGIVLF